VTQPRDLQALARSLAYATAAATAATAVGAVVAVLDVRTRLRGRQALSALARAPYTVPGTVLALGLVLAWSQEIRVIVGERVTVALYLADTGWLLILAYATKFLALPMGSIAAALRSVDVALEEAARVAGASWGRALARITAPILWPSLVSAWFLVFVPAFGEVTMSILLAGPRSRVVGVVLFELQTYGDPPKAAALAVVVAAVAICGQAIAGIRR
jgi:iron(III) transport system permease protein